LSGRQFFCGDDFFDGLFYFLQLFCFGGQFCQTRQQLATLQRSKFDKRKKKKMKAVSVVLLVCTFFIVGSLSVAVNRDFLIERLATYAPVDREFLGNNAEFVKFDVNSGK
jgi:hypothetical protein